MPNRPDSQTPRPERRPTGERSGWPRWGIWLVMGMLGATFLYSALQPSESFETITYDQFLVRVGDGDVTEARIDNQTGRIELRTDDGERLATTGPLELSAEDRRVLDEAGTAVEFTTPEPGFLSTWLPLLLPVGRCAWLLPSTGWSSP